MLLPGAADVAVTLADVTLLFFSKAWPVEGGGALHRQQAAHTATVCSSIQCCPPNDSKLVAQPLAMLNHRLHTVYTWAHVGWHLRRVPLTIARAGDAGPMWLGGLPGGCGAPPVLSTLTSLSSSPLGSFHTWEEPNTQ